MLIYAHITGNESNKLNQICDWKISTIFVFNYIIYLFNSIKKARNIRENDQKSIKFYKLKFWFLFWIFFFCMVFSVRFSILLISCEFLFKLGCYEDSLEEVEGAS